jgi:hypothetical protein
VKRFFNPSLFVLLLLAAVAVSAIGCSSTEPSNASARPWNSPRGWETGGLPGNLNEGR